MRQRSPIEMMVDKACGVTAEDLELQVTVAKPPLQLDKVTKALMRVADASMQWADARSLGHDMKRHENRLHRAVNALDALGWR